jgi:hypothetical protein
MFAHCTAPSFAPIRRRKSRPATARSLGRVVLRAVLAHCLTGGYEILGGELYDRLSRDEDTFLGQAPEPSLEGTYAHDVIRRKLVEFDASIASAQTDLAIPPRESGASQKPYVR